MRKFLFVLVAALVASSTTPAEAQFLKKLGKAAKKVEWEYNVDSGLYVHLDNYTVHVEDDDITPAGQKYLDNLPNEYNLDIKFSTDYLKPGAKIYYYSKD